MTERLYYDDAYLLAFEARVLEVRPNGENYDVLLDRSAFYPTSGGQPFDTGLLGDAQVLDVNVEDGLVTRFSVCPIENQQFAKFVPWKAIPKTEQAQIDNILNRLEMKVYKMPLKFDKSVLLDVAPEDFDRVVPWQYDFQPLERVDLSYIYQPLLDWLERERVVSAETLNPARDVFRRRAAVKGFRLALMCHGLYSNVGKRERGIIIDFVRWFCTVDLYHSLCQFGEQYNEMQNSVKAKGVPHDKVFSRMGDTFGKEDVRMALAKAFIKTPVSNVISLWKANRLIEKTGENMYRKLK